MTRILSEETSISNQYISELRDVNVQNDSLRFRRNLERLGEIIGYEISKELEYDLKEVNTPLGTSEAKILKEQPVLATILRAGLAMHRGLLNVFDKAQNAYVSAYRKHQDNGSGFDIKIEYLSSPPLDGRIVILSDPMLATGSSMVLSYEALLKKGTPKQIHVVSAISSKQGLEYTRKHLPANTKIWIATVDDELNDKAYIIPGLGDAGDLAFGEKD
ncbi:MAG: uracil phosphoribosyltransferase [Flavobacteriales bacterium]|nr:MAG: uracil phosphoribosyltransferase [Flavobacteriales bacterium]